MALMKCPECGSNVSDQATSCPMCGFPLNTGSQSQNSSTQGVYNTIGGQNSNNTGVYNASESKPQGKKKGDGIIMLLIIINSFLLWVGTRGEFTGLMLFALAALIVCFVIEAKITKHNIAVGANGSSIFKREKDVWVGLVILVLFLMGIGMSGRAKEKAKKIEEAKVSTEETTKEAQKDAPKQEKTEKPAVAKETKRDLGIKTASAMDNMAVGDIGVIDDVYIGLSYVKKMTYLPTAVGKETEIGSGNEVIMAFFDFCNGSDDSKSIDASSITCYADGVQVPDVETTWKVECDGVKQFYIETLQPLSQMASVQDYAVPVGWKELKFFYKSKCVWVVNQDRVSSDDYTFKSMYPEHIVDRTVTAEGSKIFADGYEIVFQGVSDYVYKNMVTGDQPMIAFKFTVNNKGTEAIDYSLAGYSMQAYQNNYLLESADFVVDEQIDGFSNIYSVDSVEPGMSANVYVIFEKMSSGGDYYMVYDDGYIVNTIRGTVYVK